MRLSEVRARLDEVASEVAQGDYEDPEVELHVLAGDGIADMWLTTYDCVRAVVFLHDQQL